MASHFSLETQAVVVLKKTLKELLMFLPSDWGLLTQSKVPTQIVHSAFGTDEI